MLECARGLSAPALRALADLERRTIEVDGGRLKLEWGVLRSRSGDKVEDLLWWDGDRLLGFLGRYSFGPSVELAGMVDPAARRRDIATALFDAALAVCRDRTEQQALLVVPRSSVGGKQFALSRGAVLERSEHALVLAGDPTGGSSDPRIAVRPATAADGADLSRLLAAAFGWTPPDLLGRLASDPSRTLLVELEGRPVGTVRVIRDGDVGGVYGFAVDPPLQGRGIGRDVLRRMCHQLRDEGVRRIDLEVAVDNERALGLYTSVGFSPVATEDYYAMART